MRIHHLDCTTLCPLGGPLVGARGSLLQRGTMVCHCLLVETPSSGLVLVDTGFGLADMRDPIGRFGRGFIALSAPRFDPAQSAIEQVRARGFSPTDVRHILLTHLDLDHAGGLADFAHADIHLMTDELEAARSPQVANEKQRYRPVQWSHGPRWRPHRPSEGERWFGFECARDLAGLPPEILMVPLSGHTRGHAGIAVQTGQGWVLHAGDAYFHHGEMEPEPRCPAGLRWFQGLVAVDDALRRANQGRLRDLVRAHGPEVRVMSAHDPVEFERAVRG